SKLPDAVLPNRGFPADLAMLLESQLLVFIGLRPPYDHFGIERPGGAHINKKIRPLVAGVLSEIEVLGTFALRRWQGGIHDGPGSITTADDALAADWQRGAAS